ncbi:inositol monophosphatase 1 [Bacillus rossius redtenbacheri]|uniref:inositol monophosphatase 1 n=1 Tax=Bacillus rossius redtenbacheri TaxID=93214 RepID=UPI002FDD0CE1
MALNLDVCYDFILPLIKKSGELIRDRIWSQKTVEVKASEIDLVTETDQEIERILISSLRDKFPDHKFIGEESTAAGQKCELTAAPTWIIDPVDGTMNFVHGYPNVCISVALWADCVPEIGIIYAPVVGMLFTARRGQGAFLNGNRIFASKQTDLAKALMGLEYGTTRNEQHMKAVKENANILVPKVHGVRSSGSCAMNMALTALGATDCNYEFGIHVWDIAAGMLIVTEAGGVVVDPAGGPVDVMSRRFLCASSQALADDVSRLLVQFYPERD